VHKATHETAGLAAQVIATGPARDLNVSCLIIFKQQPDEAAVNRLLQLLELVGRLDDRKQQALIDLAGIAVP